MDGGSSVGEFFGQVKFGLPVGAWLAIAVVAVIFIIVVAVVCVKKAKSKKNKEENSNTATLAENRQETVQAAPVEEAKPVEEKPAAEVKTVEETKPAEEKPVEAKPAVQKTAPKTTAAKSTAKTAPVKKEVKPAPNAEDPAPKVYHISKRKEDKKWQVKAEGADKALRLFFTQAEAIEYAKKVAGNQEGRIVVHKESGGFRKLNY